QAAPGRDQTGDPAGAMGPAAGYSFGQVAHLSRKGRRDVPRLAHLSLAHTPGPPQRIPFPRTNARLAGRLRAGYTDLERSAAVNSGVACACRPWRHVEAAGTAAATILLHGRTARDLNLRGGRGSTIQPISARRTATGINLATGTITSGFVVLGMWSGG